ncbi:uncharacterized protein LOC141646827 [Silene latifolia]|uniref:uncharacterized protein LOC141646827 n=1 Tax=Silene latifolia TaxID=37657 RepID=UPI003D77A951
MRRISVSLSSPSFSSSSSLIKPLVAVHNPLCYQLVKKYSKYERDEKILDKERAPSTAEIMDEITQEMEENERILDEKSRQGFVSQTSDKMLDAATEAISSDVDPEDVKEIYKEGSPGQTYHKPQDDGGIGPTSV